MRLCPFRPGQVAAIQAHIEQLGQRQAGVIERDAPAADVL